WLDDGSGYTVLESRTLENNDKSSVSSDQEIKGSDIVFYKPDGSGRKVLVNFEKLTPNGQGKPVTINDYAWSSNGKWLLVYTNSKKVWRSRSRGDYWVLNLANDRFFRLGGSKVDASQLMFAKFSPDSNSIAYVYYNNIFSQSLANNEITKLTHDGSKLIVNGNFDWVYEEEFTIRDGFRWSPDSKAIAYWQLNTSGVKEFTMINNTSGLYPKLTTFPYPKAGEQNSAVRIGVVSLKDKKTRWAALDGDNRERYIPRISWAGNGNEVLIQDLNRPQNTMQVRLFNWRTNNLTTLFVEQDEAFIEWYYSAEWLDDGKSFIWHSERDGWRHLYRIAKDGKSVIDLTPGDFDIVELVGFNEQKNTLYFIATGENVAQRYLFKTSLDGSFKPTRVTPESYSGTNAYRMSKDTSMASHSHSSFGVPTSSQVIIVDGHKPVTSLTDNKILKAKLARELLPSHEFFKVTARDGVELDGFIMKPHNFDSSKKYPVIFYVYGEPWGQTVQDRWGGNGYLFHSLLTQQGYIVVSVDNRGTRAPKGRDWRKSIYKKIGSITVRDQVDALDAIAQRWSFIDKDKAGIWGHSGGGSSTLNMLFRHPGVFKAGVARAPVPDIRLYDTIYQERYAGNPNIDPASYDNSSPITFAKNLEDNLLLIHGTGDDNVHYQGSEKLINELVKHGKQFDFMSYPNRSHGIGEGQGTRAHMHQMMLEFFNRHLK
ncbi:MAG: S9 family peptidase, partial [Kangiellaceae bacterium]|nr:S9 family peptidase [Kangiellaceae bacterium]